MNASEKPEFLRLLTATLGAYAKPLPEAGMLAAWWSELSPYPLRCVAEAMAAYKLENDKFPPVPVGISQRCALMDGRPGTEEAWAIALTSQDESATVVWTQEMCEAFGLCKPILELGDEVGARMAFKDAYTRLIRQARMMRQPASWTISMGWDADQRIAVVEKAAAAGLLPAPTAAALLPAPTAPSDYDENKARQNLAKIKEQLAQAMLASEQAWQKRSAHVEAEREALRKKKEAIAERVKQLEGQA